MPPSVVLIYVRKASCRSRCALTPSKLKENYLNLKEVCFQDVFHRGGKISHEPSIMSAADLLKCEANMDNIYM
jgi:hypothetical protein